MLDGLNELNQVAYDKFADPETQARISQYEMAFRMQSEVPDLMDIEQEPQHVLDLYGEDVQKPGSFATKLFARPSHGSARCPLRATFPPRLGSTRFVCRQRIRQQCKDIDQPAAALIKDLKQRGMLDDTLVVWGGEFGRTIYSQGKLTADDHGRDHHGRCFTHLDGRRRDQTRVRIRHDRRSQLQHPERHRRAHP